MHFERPGMLYAADSVIGKYVLEEEIGRGSFSVVWRARDPSLGRDVAIKIPYTDREVATADRFLREARRVAQLNHDGIVRVIEASVDTATGTPFIVLDLVDGVTLSEWVNYVSLTQVEIAEIVARVAEAIHHAHLAGIIHRDIKPSNVLISLSGQPKVTDFGLARAAGIDVSLDTRTIGTLAYMSPEQAQLLPDPVGPPSDIFSIGVLLFQLLSGSLPIASSNPSEHLAGLASGRIASLRSVVHDIPHDLDIICNKCIAYAPADRFQTAMELAAELHRFIAGRPIRSHVEHWVSRTVRTVYRNWNLSTSIAFASLAIALALWGTMRPRVPTSESQEKRSLVEWIRAVAASPNPDAIELIQNMRENRVEALEGIEREIQSVGSTSTSASTDDRENPIKKGRLAILAAHVGDLRYVKSLSQRCEDPFDRTLLIDTWGSFHGDASDFELWSRTVQESDLLSVMMIAWSRIAKQSKDTAMANRVRDVLSTIHRESPSALVHSSAQWGLISLETPVPAVPISTRDDREWFSLASDMTMVAVPMGDSQSKGSLWFSATEVSNRLFAEFDPAHYGHVYDRYEKIASRDLGAASLVSPLEMMQFCNWLSHRHGRDPCYSWTQVIDGRSLDGQSEWRVDFQRGGFRLPTSEEWQIANLASSKSKFWFGNDETTLDQHAYVFSRVAKSRVQSFPPNGFGLFDTLGDVSEVCHVAAGSQEFVRRGGSMFPRPGECEGSIQPPMMLDDKLIEVGFRIVCKPDR